LSERTQQENHTVESWLLFHEDRLANYHRDRQMILEASPRKPEVATTGFRPGKPTEDKGISLAELRERESTLAFIVDFERQLAAAHPHLLVLLRLRRAYRDRRGRDGWMAPVMQRFPVEVAALTGDDMEKWCRTSRQTFHSYWNTVVELGVREALRWGLL